MFYWTIIASICRGNAPYNNCYQLPPLSLLFQLIHSGNISMIYCILVENTTTIYSNFYVFWFLFVFSLYFTSLFALFPTESLKDFLKCKNESNGGGGGHFPFVFLASKWSTTYRNGARCVDHLFTLGRLSSLEIIPRGAL